ncbi:MAG: HAMP domain-containing sensor histidine kinase [Nannocystales bacterium]
MKQRRRSSLFWRIYATVVITVLAGTAVGVTATWFILQERSERWVGQALELLEEKNDGLVQALRDPERLETTVEAMGETLGTRVRITDPKGRPLTRHRGHDDGPPPRHPRRHAKALRQGRTLVLHRGKNRNFILFPLMDPDSGRTVGIVSVRPNDPPRGIALTVSALAMLLLLGLGARSLSRSLTSRLGRVEASALRIAGGELSHRVVTPQGAPADELDELALSFNGMADKLEALIRGQRVLLANVSHELRTPIARVRVVLEILEGRVDQIDKGGTDPDASKHIERLRKGLSDIGRDAQELESLIGDLLTSGRLDLSVAGGALEVSPVRLDELSEHMADRFSATVTSTPSPTIQGDRMLLERLLSNLLSNARRACPDGALTIEVSTNTQGYVIAVEDEGRGIAPDDREVVFEPFRRLDEARSRDQGGVGLGLYLSRQIARAHGGDLQARSRIDGASGARMVIELPKTPPSRG